MDFLYLDYKDEGGNAVKLRLSATVTVGYSQKGKVTEYHIEAGAVAGDHYAQEADTISFTGQISAFSFFRPEKNKEGKTNWTTPPPTSLLDYETLITRLKQSGEFFKCSFSNNLHPMTNCLFTSLTMTRSAQTGIHAMDVSFSIKQVQEAAQAGVKATPVPANQYKDMVEDKKKNSGATTGSGDKKCKHADNAVSSGVGEATVSWLQGVCNVVN